MALNFVRQVLPRPTPPRLISGATFGVLFGVLLFVFTGAVGGASDRWGLFGILIAQTGGWLGAVRTRSGTRPERALRALLIANAVVLLTLDLGLLGPYPEPYYFYERAMVPFAIAIGVISIGFAVFAGVRDWPRAVVGLAAALGAIALVAFFAFFRDNPYGAVLVAVVLNAVIFSTDLPIRSTPTAVR